MSSAGGPADSGDAGRCCDHCGAQSAELLVCNGCDAGYYCTTECQHGAWFDLLRVCCVHFLLFTMVVRPGHKKECRAVQKQRKAAQEEAEKQQTSGPVCDVCGVQSPAVFACPACNSAHYCSSEHQHDAWFVRLTSKHTSVDLRICLQAGPQEGLPTSRARANRRSANRAGTRHVVSACASSTRFQHNPPCHRLRLLRSQLRHTAVMQPVQGCALLQRGPPEAALVCLFLFLYFLFARKRHHC